MAWVADEPATGKAAAAAGLLEAGQVEDRAALVARALGHPARLRIVLFLLAKEACIGGDLVAELGLAQSTVSEHLRILKAAGVVTAQADLPRICYGLNPESLLPLAGLLNSIVEKGGKGELNGSICLPPACPARADSGRAGSGRAGSGRAGSGRRAQP